jgi:hypothetical protein
MTKKIYNVVLRAWGGRWRCGLRDSVGSMASRALGHHRDDHVACLGRTTTQRARGRHESTTLWAQEQHRVHNVMGSGRTMLLRAREWCHRLGDGACVADSVTDSGRGRWWRVEGLDRGWERRRGGYGEDSMTARALRRSTMAQAPGIFLAENFGILTA